MKKQIRVSDLAKEFGTTSEAILKLLWSQGFQVRSGSSRVDSFAVEWLRFEFTVEGPILPPVRRTGVPPANMPPRPDAAARRAERMTRTDAWIGSSRRHRFLRESPPPRRLVNRSSARSIRSVPLLGTAAELAGLNVSSIEKGLLGSPYSVPVERAEYLSTSFLPRVAAVSYRAQRAATAVAVERRTALRRVRRSTEIYESNRIEGLGPDLATTDKVLNANQLHREADVSIARQAIERCLTAEPKVRDVVGLGAARILAEVFCSEPHRALTESDLRELHQLVMVGDPRGGVYKAYVNQIEGSDHVPTPPSDTPAAMSNLVRWLSRTDLAPLWRAAVAHAWLTHIHPFHDGNGRIARLLANLVLIREGVPPIIISASSDRGEYLDALAASDTGGDILPLAEVFRSVLARAVSDLANPEQADEVFNAEVTQIFAPRHVRWNNMVSEFLAELAPQLLLHRLTLYLIGEVTDGDLLRIGQGNPDSAWLAKVGVNPGERDLLLHVGSPTTVVRKMMKPEHVTPSIFVSVKAERPLDARAYLPVGPTTYTYEFTPLVDEDHFVLRRQSTTTRLPIHEGASVAAEHLSRAYRQLIGRP